MQIDRLKLTLFFTCLPYDWTEDSLTNFLTERGYDVVAVRRNYHPPEHPRFPGKFKGSALVEFKTEEDVRWVLDTLQGFILPNNKDLKVSPARMTIFFRGHVPKPAPRKMTETEYFEALFLNADAA